MPHSLTHALRTCSALLAALALTACGDASPTDPTAAQTPTSVATPTRRVFTYTIASTDSTGFAAALLDVAATGGAVDSITVEGGSTEQFEGRTLVLLAAESRTATLRVVAPAAVSAVTLAVREAARGDGAMRDSTAALRVEPVK